MRNSNLWEEDWWEEAVGAKEEKEEEILGSQAPACRNMGVIRALGRIRGPHGKARHPVRTCPRSTLTCRSRRIVGQPK